MACRGGLIINSAEGDRPPPGFKTTTGTVPAIATSAAHAEIVDRAQQAAGDHGDDVLNGGGSGSITSASGPGRPPAPAGPTPVGRAQVAIPSGQEPEQTGRAADVRLGRSCGSPMISSAPRARSELATSQTTYTGQGLHRPQTRLGGGQHGQRHAIGRRSPGPPSPAMTSAAATGHGGGCGQLSGEPLPPAGREGRDR